MGVRWISRTSVAAVVLMGAVLGRGSGVESALDSPVFAPPTHGGVIQVGGKALSQTIARTKRLSPHLDLLYRVDLALRNEGKSVSSAHVGALPANLRGLERAKRMYLDPVGRVQVWVNVDGLADARAAQLATLGMFVQRTDNDQGIVQGLLPITRLRAAAALPYVSFVELPEYGVAGIGSTTTQGDSILLSADLRAQLSITGPVKVGVISDGVAGLAAAQSSGDLPAVDYTTCNTAPTSGGSPPSPVPSPIDPIAGAEGTAMLEIVHDIVPQAELFFGYFGYGAGGTVLDFEEAVQCLAQHTDVVVDDIQWFNVGPYDGTSSVSMNASNALNDPANPIRAYVTVAGNQADRHYREPWNTSDWILGDELADFWLLHEFQATSTTTDAGQYGAYSSCGASGAPYCANRIRVAPGGSFFVALQWNDPFTASGNDYDLLVYDPLDTSAGPSGTIYASGQVQDGAGEPAEAMAFVNDHGVTADFYIFIGNYRNTAAPRTFDMFVNCSACFPLGIAIQNFNTVSRSVPNNGDAGGGVISAGTINASDPGNDTIAYYSSRGPTIDGRTKPDITGIDGVSITGSGGFPSPFYGTSAAAPHIAGIAALLLSCNPALLSGEAADDPVADRFTLRSSLMNSALDLGAVGVDNTYGAGRARATSAAPLAGCIDGDGDAIPDGLDNCPGAANGGQTNTDVAVNPPGDAAGDACDDDDDDDGCADVKELGSNHLLGGQRDPLDPWDFFDVTEDRWIDVVDALTVLMRFGEVPGSELYDPWLDRFVPDPARPWKTAPSNDLLGIDVNDVLVNLQSFGDDCT